MIIDFGGHQLPGMLEVAVPLQIANIEQLTGQPTEHEIEQARAFADTLGEQGDVLLYGGKRGEAAKIFVALARAVAVLAFCPGGVRLFGCHWKAGDHNKQSEVSDE